MYYFYNTYVSTLRDSVLENLRKLLQIYSYFDVVFTGHSLGGAVAEHAALDAALSGLLTNGMSHKVNALIYTYGEPRIGNRVISDMVDDFFPGKYYRVTHNRDLVPHVPPCGPTLTSGCMTLSTIDDFYTPYHAGREIFYNEDSTSYVECDEGESPDCSDSLTWHLSIADHLEYLQMDFLCD